MPIIYLDFRLDYKVATHPFQAQGRLADALREFEAYKQIMLSLTQRDPENTDWQRNLSASHNCVGQVFQAQGRLADALREFEADLVIAQQLVARDPGNSVWQENLNVTRTCIDQMQRG